MAQATHDYSRFHNLSNEMLADAIGHADAVLYVAALLPAAGLSHGVACWRQPPHRVRFSLREYTRVAWSPLRRPEPEG